ncbi:MAG: hypothetical protein ABIR16_03595 [Dokdonella sp.]
MRILFRRFMISALLVTGVSALALPVRAIAGEDSLQEVIDRVEHDNDCKVLGVQVMEHDGRKVYVIKMLTKDGRVKVVQVRASQ